MSAGFCQAHQRWLNEFGWCADCGEPKSAIRPPLPLHASPIFLFDEIRGREPGTALRHCEDPIHVFEKQPGRCQCGQRFWTAEPAAEEAGKPQEGGGR